MPDFTSVAKTSDLAPGECKVVDANGTAIALFNLDGTFYALDNTCAHHGGPIGDGFCEGNIVKCPWHGWPYDITTGECTRHEGQKVDAYEVQVVGDDVQVKV